MAAHDGRDRSTGAKAMGAPAKGKPAWLIPLILGLLGVLLLLLLLSQCGGDDDAEDTATSGVGTTATETVPPTASSTTGDGTGAAGAAGTVTADGTPLLPLAEASEVGADGDLSGYAGQSATTTSVQVQSVPTDEGFWVGSSDADRVWVQLTGQAGESPFTVKEGDSVAFTGTVTKAPSGFPKEIGLTDAEGGPMLALQGQYISVKKSELKLAS